MQISIDLPNDFLAFQAMPEIRQEISTSYALWLYQRSRITLVKAADLAEVKKHALLKQHGYNVKVNVE